MNLFVDRHRRFCKSRIAFGNYDRVSQIRSMKNNSASGPAANEIAFGGMIRDIGKFSEIPKRKRWMIPFVKTNRWRGRASEQRFINRHVDRRRARSDVVVDVQRN